VLEKPKSIFQNALKAYSSPGVLWNSIKKNSRRGMGFS